jgi:N-acetyl-gamma-glutamyl-phosphate reductase
VTDSAKPARKFAEAAVRVGLIGARGYVGAELIRLIAAHPYFELAYVGSRELAGQRVADQVDTYPGDLRYSSPTNAELPALGADAVVLALPNGKAADVVAAFDAVAADSLVATPVIIDLSADYRFDDGWYYGLPELTRGAYRGQRRISNPGCYATAMQLAVAPMRDRGPGAVLRRFGLLGRGHFAVR